MLPVFSLFHRILWREPLGRFWDINWGSKCSFLCPFLLTLLLKFTADSYTDHHVRVLYSLGYGSQCLSDHTGACIAWIPFFHLKISQWKIKGKHFCNSCHLEDGLLQTSELHFQTRSASLSVLLLLSKTPSKRPRFIFIKDSIFFFTDFRLTAYAKTSMLPLILESEI